jgi:quercetin dioxygenase-like cupin family protein
MTIGIAGASGHDARLGRTRFAGWLSQSSRQIPDTNLQPAADTGRRQQLMAGSKSMLALAFLITSSMMAQETITPLMSKDLQGVSGKEVLMYTVDFPAGFSSPVHRHNAQVSLYVLEGSVVMQVKGGKEITLTPGQTFYEGPDDIHVVSRNASSTKPAKFLVFLVKEKGAPLVVPEK